MAASFGNHSNGTHGELIAFGVIYMMYAPVIVFVNALLIVSMIATKQSLKKSSNLLIVCLSSLDTLTGAIVMPILAVESIWYDFSWIDSLLMISWFLQIYFNGASINMTLLLALDRYVHMNPEFHRSPSKLSKLFKLPNIYATIFALGLLPTGIVVGILISAYQKFPAYFSLCKSSYIVCLVLVAAFFVALYIRGYLRIRRYVANNPIYANNEGPNANEAPAYVNELFKTILLVLLSMTVFWLPTLLFYGVYSVTTNVATIEIHPYTYLICDLTVRLLYYANSMANALIIFYRNKKSKDWLHAKFQNICNTQRVEVDEPNVSD